MNKLLIFLTAALCSLFIGNVSAANASCSGIAKAPVWSAYFGQVKSEGDLTCSGDWVLVSTALQTHDSYGTYDLHSTCFYGCAYPGGFVNGPYAFNDLASYCISAPERTHMHWTNYTTGGVGDAYSGWTTTC